LLHVKLLAAAGQMGWPVSTRSFFMDVWEIIRRSALNDGMDAGEREAVLQLCSDRTAELERLRSAAESACAERDRLAGELGIVKRAAAVKRLAEKHNFTDPDYLDFLLQKREVAMDDHAAVEAAVNGLKNEIPRFFRVDIHSGPAEKAGSCPGRDSDRTDLTTMVSNAPEAGF
jgi:hypothetical protein